MKQIFFMSCGPVIEVSDILVTSQKIRVSSWVTLSFQVDSFSLTSFSLRSITQTCMVLSSQHLIKIIAHSTWSIIVSQKINICKGSIQQSACCFHCLTFLSPDKRMSAIYFLSVSSKIAVDIGWGKTFYATIWKLNHNQQ